MADATIDLLKSSFRQLRLPSMSREFERLARDAAATNQNYFEFLLRLAESELATLSCRYDLAADQRREVSGLEGLRDSMISVSCRNSPSRRYWSWRVVSGLNTSTIVAL